MYKPDYTDVIFPGLLLIFSVCGLIVFLLHGGWNGAMLVGMGFGALAGFGMWMASLSTTYTRDASPKQSPLSAKPVMNATPVIVLTVILVSIVNGLLRLSVDVDGRAVFGAFIAVFLIGTSLSQLWEIGYDWRQARDTPDDRRSYRE